MVNGMPQSPSKQRPRGVHFFATGIPYSNLHFGWGVHTQSIILIYCSWEALCFVLFEKKIRFVLTPKKMAQKKPAGRMLWHFVDSSRPPIMLSFAQNSRICKVSCQCLGADKPPKGGVGRGCKGDIRWSCEAVSWVILVGTHVQFFGCEEVKMLLLQWSHKPAVSTFADPMWGRRRLLEVRGCRVLAMMAVEV